ncbi:FAD-dependent monooxygenase [Nocardioides sp.]|uniref:FAD-dependent monooxygenase n=1 Tax=Nocardioides sp. TaxID=35761 RepID=UPI00263948C5|nr:FAD-dependent monooxygenase [Nocardioides sp.]
MRTEQDYDVVVAGAGPTGFTLAIDLGQRGVRVLLVEKDPTTKQFPKMDRSNARTMEIFRRLGFVDRVRELGYPADNPMDVFVVTRLVDPPLTMLEYPSVAEHREVIAAATDGSEPLEPYQLVSQNDLEPLLREVAEATQGVTVRFGCELVGFAQDDDGVDVVLRTAAGDESVRAGYLAGCDGGASPVRKQLGIKLAGRGNLIEQRQVTFRSEGLYDSIKMGKGRHYYVADLQGAVFIVQGSRTHITLNAQLPPEADLEAEVRSRIGFETDVELVNSTTWRLHLLLAERYRDRRVFLAGDAAHLVIPTGGLGMNSGVGDAVDLAWKLAGTVHGWGGPGLLDSYEPERRRVGERNVRASGWAAEGLGLWRALVTADVAEATSEGERVRAEVAAAAQVHQRRVHEMIGVELGYSYAGSALVAHEPGEERDSDWETTTYTPHTRPGVRVPHVWRKDGSAVQDVVGRDFTVLDLTGRAALEPLVDAFADLGAPLSVVTSDEPDVRAAYGCSLLLLRPDLHVAWRGKALPGDPAAVAGLAAMATGQRDSSRIWPATGRPNAYAETIGL